MATIEKIDMIRELVEGKKVNDLRQGKESYAALVTRLFETLSKREIEKMYKERIGKAPEAALADVTEKVKAVVETPAEKVASKEDVAPKPKRAKKKKQPKRSPEEAAKYVPAVDEKGREYKKAWILNVLNDTGFSSMNRNKRTLQGEFYTIVYNHEKYRLDVFDPRLAGVSVAYTLCLCECMVKGFIKNYSSTKKAIKPLPEIKREEVKVEKPADEKTEPKAEKKTPAKKVQKEVEKSATKKAIKTKEATATKKVAAKKK